MNRSRILTSLLLAVLFLFFALPAHAHKLNVFSWAGDRQIYGETFFNGGRKAKNITVHVQDVETHTSLLTTQTDDEGKFQFTPPQQAVQQKLDLLISVNSGDGHRGEWLLTADEYLSPDDVRSSVPQKDRATKGGLDVETVREIVRQELARKLVPIKRHLAERKEKKVNIRDIIGGIGCIIGLAALFAWIQSNNKKKKKTSTEV
jgi:nickel transport protein